VLIDADQPAREDAEEVFNAVGGHVTGGGAWLLSERPIFGRHADSAGLQLLLVRGERLRLGLRRENLFHEMAGTATRPRHSHLEAAIDALNCVCVHTLSMTWPGWRSTWDRQERNLVA